MLHIQRLVVLVVACSVVEIVILTVRRIRTSRSLPESLLERLCENGVFQRVSPESLSREYRREFCRESPRESLESLVESLLESLCREPPRESL